MKEFNTTGNCDPNSHYMVNITNKISQIVDMVTKRKYFTINRARQYGKTTTLDLLEVRLLELGYTVAYLSFEGVDHSSFATPKQFCHMFMQKMKKYLHDDMWMNENVDSFSQLSEHTERLCNNKKIVLFIDEVDKTSHNLVFMHFLGMLRDKYLKRGKFPTFYSVILVGVVDIKNIKIVMEQKGIIVRKENEGSHNSPWNIAADFEVDMSFSPIEIATMLCQYEDDNHTCMDISYVSQEIYNYTSGYPFLVSRICKYVDEKLNKDWSLNGIRSAVKIMLTEKNTLFDDMSKNLENNQELREFTRSVLINGEIKKYTPDDVCIDFGVMFGYFKNLDGQVAISNRIFEIRITNYLILRDGRTQKQITGVLKEDIVHDDKFDMALCIEKFAKHYYSSFSNRDLEFYERHGRLLFLAYLQPLINGKGFYHIESETRNTRRMDIIVDYGTQQFIVELKLWNGDVMHDKAYTQLLSYMDSKDKAEGYLLTFDFRQEKSKEHKAVWVNFSNKRIFDVIV